MGDRINFVFKVKGTELALYSHWGGSDAKETLARALRAAEPRWSDETYGVRITTSHIIGEDWASETGFGLYVGDGVYFDEVLEIDWDNQSVDGHSFEDFCTYHGAPKEVEVSA